MSNSTFTIWDAIRAERDNAEISYLESQDLWGRIHNTNNRARQTLERLNDILKRRTGQKYYDDWFICEYYGTPFPANQQTYTFDDEGPYSTEVEDNTEYLVRAEGTGRQGSDLLARRETCLEIHDGTYITEQLYEYDYTRCAACEEIFHNNDTYYRESHDAYYCESCDPGEDDDEAEDTSTRGPNSGRIYSYSTNVEDIIEVDLESGVRYFGLELEMEFPGETPSYWAQRVMDGEDYVSGLLDTAIWKSDGSLNNGAELVSIPLTIDEWREPGNPVKGVCNHKPLRRVAKSHNTTTCGLHVHVSRETIPEPVVAKVVYLMNEPSMFDLTTSIARRSPNVSYCTASKKAWHSSLNHEWRRAIADEITDKPAALYARRGWQLHKKQYPQDGGRYTPVNLTEHTLEFRIFRGSLVWDTVLASIEFVDAVISYCTQFGAAKLNGADFRAWLKTTHLRKTYPALRAYLYTRGVLIRKPVPEAHILTECQDVPETVNI